MTSVSWGWWRNQARQLRDAQQNQVKRHPEEAASSTERDLFNLEQHPNLS